MDIDTSVCDTTHLFEARTGRYATYRIPGIVVTTTGMATEMGQIASMLESVKRKRSPLQRELDSLTKILGFIAWGAVAIIIAIGAARGLEAGDLLLLGTAMAISAIPTGLPTFVQAMLAYGSKQLA